MNSAEFYDKMANDYHLIFSDLPGSSERQGETIQRLLCSALGAPGPFRVLDCSCGIGTQALGLARLGHQVTGTDISAGAIQRARSEAARQGLSVAFEVADMRSLEEVRGPFDAVISFDNSLAHLTGVADLAFSLSSVLAMLRPTGVFLCSLRDYDALRIGRPTGTIPRRIVDSSGERVVLQTWDWSDDGRTYDLRLFVIKRSGDTWSGRPLETQMRAFTRGEIVAEIDKTPGFAQSEWLFPEESGYYQPVLLARKS